MDWVVYFRLHLALVHHPECHKWSVGSRLCLLARWSTRLLWQWLLHCLWVNGSTHMNHFLPSTHQRLAGDCTDMPQVPFDKSSVWPDGKSKQAYPALVARAQPTVPHSWFRLDMTKNKILARFHNYFVPEKVQCGVVNSLLKIKLWWPLRNSERLLSEIFTINFVARHWKYLYYIQCGRFKLQPRKQQEILHFVARNNCSFQKRKTLSGIEASTNIQIYNNLQKGICADMLTVPGWTKNRKGEFVRQYVKKCLGLGFTAASCSEQSPRLLRLVYS